MMTEFVRDISEIDYTSRVTVEDPLDLPFLEEAKRTTNARICVGKAGTGLRTETMLRYLADHAAANDAVWAHVDESFFEAQGFLRLATLAPDKEAYLKRPDLGRDFSPKTIETLKASCPHGVQVQVVVGDGLSACAVERNIPDLFPVLMEGIGLKSWTVGRPIFVRHARVAVMDKISVALDAEVTVLLIGERPGLATNESLSCYMAWRSSPEKPESQRTVISNIHPRGTPPVEAGAQIVHLIEILLREKKSGSDLRL